MNCEQARDQIDEGTLPKSGGPGAAAASDAALDAHLTGCAACREHARSVAATDKLLAGVRSDRPTNEEMETMWNTLALSLPGSGAVTVTPRRKPRPRLRLALYSVSVAAVLLIAAQLGSIQSGGEAWMPRLQSLSRSREFSSQMRAVGGSRDAILSEAYDRDWGTPDYSAERRERSDLAAAGPSKMRDASARKVSKMAPGGGVAGSDRPSDAQLDYSVQAVRSLAPATLPSPPAPTTLSIPGETPSSIGRLASGVSNESVVGVSGQSFQQQQRQQQIQHQVPGGSDGGSQDRKDDVPNQPVAPPSPAGDAASSNAPSVAKIIRTGKLIVEVPSYAESAAQVEQIVIKYRGFIGDSNVVELTGGAITGTLVIRVPAEQFDVLFAALKALGRIVSEHSDAADVTAAYVDLEARIHSHQVTEERLHDLVRNKSIVDKVSSLLEVERELQRVRSEIEQMQGELRVMGDRVALSTITLALSEPKRIVPTASLSVEVSTVEETSAALGVTLAAIDGRLISGKTSKRSDGTLTANYQLQTPLSRFGELMNAIQGMGRIEERQVSDREFTQINEPWAAKVQCNVALTVFERSRQLPAGTMFIEAEKLETAMQQLDSFLEPTHTRVVSSYTSVDPHGANKAETSLSVPAVDFAALVESVRTLGRVNALTVTGESKGITGGAASVLCELRLTITEVVREVPSGQIAVEVDAFESARNAVSSLVAEKNLQVLDSSSQQNHDGSWLAEFQLGVEAQDMEAVVGRLESLGRVVSRNMQGIGLGSLSRTDPHALGRLHVNIAETSAIAPAPQQAGQTLRTHLRDGLEGLYKSVGLIAYGLIVMGPWLAIAILLGWLIGRVRNRRTKVTS